MNRPLEPLEEEYFKWLCSPLERRRDVTLDWQMLKIMHDTPFEYFVPNDQNRALDGRQLREEFFVQYPEMSNLHGVEDWLGLECSVLEMLLALADRASYQSGVRPTTWFQMFLNNMGLPGSPTKVRQALRRLNKRAYSWDGSGGGLFPLRFPLEDQTTVEIWYQMSAYIIENHSGEEV